MSIEKNLDILNELDKHSDYVKGKINRGIEENRKGLFRLRFRELPDGDIKVKQINHEFKFGAPLFVLDQLESGEKNELYKKRFLDICNYAIIPLYWKDLEPERGNFRFASDSEFIWRRPPLDTVFEFCKANGLRTKGHCLVYNSFNPYWISGLTNREINIAIEDKMKAISERYGNGFLDMDVINEMYSVYKNCYMGSGNGARDLAVTEETDHPEKMFGLAKKYFPYTKLFWNEGIEETFGRIVYKGERSTYYMMLKEQLEKGTPIEGIGIQYHMFMTDGTADLNGVAFCNPLRLFDALDCYGKFGLPIHISEISVPAYGQSEEEEQLQAEIVKRIYALFFSQKNVESIVWWNLADGMAYGNEGIYRAGLLGNDLSEKPAYKAVRSLIKQEWNTEAVLPVGEVSEFVGFYGDYEISYTSNGNQISKTVRLYKENTGYDNRTMNPKEILIGD